MNAYGLLAQDTVFVASSNKCAENGSKRSTLLQHFTKNEAMECGVKNCAWRKGKSSSRVLALKLAEKNMEDASRPLQKPKRVGGYNPTHLKKY